MYLKRILHLAMIMVFMGVFTLLWGEEDLWGSTFTLDDEAVFCIYHKMSGKDMNEQDMEDLCSKAGRPVFTAYKPSEMFIKHGLGILRDKLTQKIGNYKEDSLFRWAFKGTLKSNKKLIIDKKGMPQPTSYISSEISKRGWRYVRRMLNSLAVKKLSSGKTRELEITVLLRPEKIDYRFQKRNVAHEDIVLPIRCVIFYPVRVEVFDETMTIETIFY